MRKLSHHSTSPKNILYCSCTLARADSDKPSCAILAPSLVQASRKGPLRSRLISQGITMQWNGAARTARSLLIGFFPHVENDKIRTCLIL